MSKKQIAAQNNCQSRNYLRPGSIVFYASLAIASVTLTAAVSGQKPPAPPPLAAAPPSSSQTIWLDQGWTSQQRDNYHYQSQGTQTLPIPAPWFVALEVPKKDAGAGFVKFSDPAYLQRFGFIPGVRTAANPNALPIGFASTTSPNPKTGRPMKALGFTCAACHTARIDYRGTTLLIDGGPAMIDLGSFGTKLALSLGETFLSGVYGPRFRRFAEGVLGPNPSVAKRIALEAEIGAVLLAGLGDVLQSPSKGNVTEGAGRLDALNRIGNTVFGSGMNIAANRVAITAPVNFPHIWDTSWFAWVQYNGSIEQPMIRNAGEAMGVGAIINFRTAQTARFTSSVPVNRLHDPIEQLLKGDMPPLPDQRFSGLRSPAWPGAILGEIDPTLAARGAALYQAKCQSCHLPAINTAEFWTSSRWTSPNAAGQRYLDLVMSPITQIGTDPAQAEGMAKRIVKVPPALGIPNPVSKQGTNYSYEFGPALGEVVERVVNRWYDSQTPPTPQADRERMNGYRPNGIRAPLAYKARPLDGIWATAPYLHNGAVPTLWDMLAPYRERPSTFSLGTTVFDPVKVGYTDAGSSLINTSIRGNRNGGHLFDNTPGLPGTLGAELSMDERRALLEYLKTL